MKYVFAVISTCVLAGSFVATADAATGSHAKKHHRHANFKDEAVQPVVMKDEKPSDPYPWMSNLSGSLAFVSNYIFRGVTQTQNLPAVQGGLTYTFPYGIYISGWGSNVKFPSNNQQATVELDSIIGNTNTFDDFKYDINVARYNYPGARFANYNELNTLFNYKFLQAGISYSANVYNTHESGTYYQGGINYNVPSNYVFNVNDVNFKALAGHYNLPGFVGGAYSDYLISLGKGFKNYVLSVQYSNTSYSSNYDGSQIVGQIAATF
jgi:uncharacterized protein (TIGR02001 family)